jgi:methylglutaconyl-CoA hydratase
MNTHLVTREDRGPVALLTLNRPEQRNALSRALLARLRDLVDSLGRESKIRAVVLTGAGSVFCAGMDLKEATAIDALPDAEVQTIHVLQEFADLLQKLHTSPKPTVAAVHGDAIAGGAGLMASCDLAVAAQTARIGYPEVRLGLVPAIVIHDLTRQIGERRARQLVLTGEPISSEVALEWGLVNHVTKQDRCVAAAMEIAHALAEGAPLAQAMTKRLIDEALSRPLDLRGAAATSAVVRSSEEARQGIRAFVEKRRPPWASAPAEAPSAQPGTGP